MSRTRARPFIILALGAFIGSVAVVAAWIFDSRAHQDAVLPNVVLAGERIRGHDAAELRAIVDRTAREFSGATVEVRSQGGAFQATVPELGVSVNPDRTLEEALAAGRRGAAPQRLWQWARSFLWAVKIPVAIDVDEPKLQRIVAERDPGRTPPVEPSLEVRDGRIDGVAGKPGRGVDPATLAEALRRTAPSGGTVLVTMDVTAVPPRFTEAEADRLASEAERLGTGGLEVAVGDRTAFVPPEVLYRWVRAVPTDAGLQLGIKDDAEVTADLTELLPDAGVPPVDAGFVVRGGQVSITPSKPGSACCAPEAHEVIAQALLDPAQRAGAVQLPLKEVPPQRDEEAARTLGIVEQVGTFTTNHAAGEPRVRNIHLMADTVRGAVLEPGETFSINGTVGRRTAEKGYVEAPIISNEYKFEADVGGGVSQFATTMFNAAFFAGLDITEYAMHGLYISRYPYGREATLSFPSPDLKVRNSTPYGVLVWTSYTDSSITVSFYSTKHIEADQSGQTREELEARPPATAPPDAPNPGPCVAVTTERTRKYLADGRSEVDRFSALYAPAEGWSCSSRG